MHTFTRAVYIHHTHTHTLKHLRVEFHPHFYLVAKDSKSEMRAEERSWGRGIEGVSCVRKKAGVKDPMR